MKKWLAFLLTFAVLVSVAAGCSNNPTPQDRLAEYVKLWNQQKFDKMYGLLSTNAKKSISQKDFVNRYKKIYRDLQITDLKVDFQKTKDDKQAKEATASYTYSAQMNSIAGKIQFTNKANLKKEDKDWYINWDTSYIFPQLKKGDRVGVSTTAPKRGEILDRNGNPMAVNGQAYEVGVVPGKLGEQKDVMIAQLASLLQMTPEQINKAITASWVKPEYFVPLKKVALDDQARIAELIKLEPVQTKKVTARIYPYKEAAAQLIGYIGQITADELAKLKDKGYNAQDEIGKRGLEQVFDEQLKGQRGVKITVIKQNGTDETLAEKPVEDGKNITLTIDGAVQQKIFAEMNGEAGTAAAMNPMTGETLALVSSPSFDPNQAAIGFSADEWKALQDNPQKPLATRFKQVYAPGSVMKPITASVGLATGKINPGEAIAINGLKWQKDQSWGNYFVTRVHQASPVDLEKALVYSDNIYFAQAALKIGKEPFSAGLKKFGFTETLDYPFPLETSQIGQLANDIALADSGYGQGQIQMNIVHLMAAYTPLLNGGNLMKPVLLQDDPKSQVWKQQVITAEQANLLSGMLRKVVADPNGTAHRAEIPGYPISGKTGTAEIKQKQGETGTENGWFVAYSPNLMMAMMIENVQGRGGSQVPVEKVKNLFTQMK
ncbi:penicillin-binding transpeptidase domain-containing protein [Neobacillus sp. SM06]|uniref:penicillin-binding transpeptidase domain-containing protein n=1 Tax=Neobacillus sp. SM06 TaxID=3422492 RepID=UPI003D270C2E